MKRIARWIVIGPFYAGRAVVCSSLFYFGTALGLIWPAARVLRVMVLGCMGMRKVESGALLHARALAMELLAWAQTHRDDDSWGWEAGNGIHKGNIVLGLAALREGDVEQAKAHLLAAGRTPGSPQLDSFGPNMRLAKELLESGECDIVLEYFDLCRTFWQLGDEHLAYWTAVIRRGEVPDFRAHLLW